MLGFAIRSGNVAFGADAATAAVAKGKAQVVLIDEGAAQNTQKAVQAACAAGEVALIGLPPMQLEEITRRSNLKVVAVLEANFAEQIAQAAKMQV